MSKPSPFSFRRWRDFTWRGPGSRWLALAALVIVLTLSGLLAAGLAGFSRGLADRQAATQVQISQRLAAGVEQMEAGDFALAAVEFQQVLQLDPDNSEARGYLQAMQATATPQPAATVAPLLLVPPAGATPLPTLPTVELPTEILFKQAQEALESKDWSQAIATLDRLTALDGTFQADQVQEMRFSAYAQQGQTFVSEERYEEALRSFDQALVIRPGDEEIKTTRELIALYVDALGRWRLDWPGVIGNLQAIETREPGFLDVDVRLRAAYEAWGDSLVRDSQWCDAVERYQVALDMGASQDIEDKRDQAEAGCTTPPAAVAEETAQPDATPASTGTTSVSTGRLVFSTFDTQFSRWTVYRLPLQGERKAQAVAEAASQPVLSPDGNFLAVRSERNDQTGLAVMSASGADRRRLTTFFEDSHPAWSPDGSQITFASNREGDRTWRIYRVAAPGGDGTFVEFGRWPAWSPRNDVIAYQGCRPASGRCGLMTIAPFGGEVRQITDVPGDTMPAWSPDGARIAFASAERGGSWDIFVLELASGNVATLAASPGVDAHPTWSPDGRQVAFLSNRDGAWAIYTVDVARGQTQRVLTLPGTLPDWYEAQLDWGQ